MNISFEHQPLTPEEIVALEPALTRENRPHWIYRFLWGTVLSLMLFALYRRWSEAGFGLLLVAAFYYFCFRRLFWPGRKKYCEDCRKILSARPYFIIPHTITLTDNRFSLESPNYTSSLDYRLLAHYVRIPSGNDELLFFPDISGIVLRRNDFPESSDYGALFGKLEEARKQNRESIPTPLSPSLRIRLAVTRKVLMQRIFPFSVIFGGINALFCAWLLWIAGFSFLLSLGVAFFWCVLGSLGLWMFKISMKLRRSRPMFPEKLYFRFDREQGMLESHSDMNSTRIAVSFFNRYRQKGDLLLLWDCSILPPVLVMKNEFASEENRRDFLEYLRDNIGTPKRYTCTDSSLQEQSQSNSWFGWLVWLAILLYLAYRIYGGALFTK
ncbi:MAG: hypothetical protein V8T90_05080 [Victivallales bacterium]